MMGYVLSLNFSVEDKPGGKSEYSVYPLLLAWLLCSGHACGIGKESWRGVPLIWRTLGECALPWEPSCVCRIVVSVADVSL